MGCGASKDEDPNMIKYEMKEVGVEDFDNVNYVNSFSKVLQNFLKSVKTSEMDWHIQKKNFIIIPRLNT